MHNHQPRIAAINSRGDTAPARRCDRRAATAAQAASGGLRFASWRDRSLDPALRRLAPDFHGRLEPGCVFEGASLDELQTRHGLDISHDRRPAVAAKSPQHGQAALADVIECLERLTLDPEA